MLDARRIFNEWLVNTLVSKLACLTHTQKAIITELVASDVSDAERRIVPDSANSDADASLADDSTQHVVHAQVGRHPQRCCRLPLHGARSHRRRRNDLHVVVGDADDEIRRITAGQNV